MMIGSLQGIFTFLGATLVVIQGAIYHFVPILVS